MECLSTSYYRALAAPIPKDSSRAAHHNENDQS